MCVKRLLGSTCVGSDLRHEPAEQVGFLQLGGVCGVLEPDQLLAGSAQLVEVALGSLARGHLIEAALDHDDWDADPGK